jgi:transposase
MAHVVGRSRDQGELIPQTLDELISADHPVRVIDGFVDTLDLSALGFAGVEPEAMGRPSYSPGDLLKLYIYGYMNQMRSSRRLEREAQRNMEVHWLVHQLRPSFKTIADFRRDHPDAIVKVSKAFVQFCRSLSLVGKGTVAIDGTKIWAAASRKKVITPKLLAEREAAVERKITAYLEAMNEADQEEADDPADEVDVPAALKALEAQRETLRRQAKELKDAGLKQRVEGESEARLMRTPRHGHQVAYNAQTAVDSEHKLIVAFDLTNEGNDERQLYPMASLAKQALEAESLTVAADTGYSNGEQGEACEQAGILAIAPRPEVVNPRGETLFTRDDFVYDAQSDAYRCPAGETLNCVKVSKTEKKKDYGTKACEDCPIKAQCTRGARRTISRGFHEDARQAMHARASADPKWMKIRRCTAEHPFGTLKWMMGSPRFLVRGLKKAGGELALSVVGYNLKRAIRILGVERMLQALNPVAA